MEIDRLGVRQAWWSIVGGTAASILLAALYELVGKTAITDAQGVLLFVPTAPIGAMAGYVLADVREQGRRATSGRLAVIGTISLAMVALFVWMGMQKLGDIPSRLLSPWCAVPAIIGCAELVSADQLRRRGKAQRQAQGSTT